MFSRIILSSWFCSTVAEIKRIGLRDASYLLDWLLTHDSSKVIEMIQYKEKIRLYEEDMIQYKGDSISIKFLGELPYLKIYILNKVKKLASVVAEHTKTKVTIPDIITTLQHLLKFKVNNDASIHIEGQLEKKSNKKIVLYHFFNECCGCGACVAICPKQAISMEIKEDFYYPLIDHDQCIKCKQCLRVCPFK